MRQAQAMVGVCVTSGQSFNDCWADTAELRQLYKDGYWPPIVLASIVPIPFLWLFGWVSLRIGRWVFAGFSS